MYYYFSKLNQFYVFSIILLFYSYIISNVEISFANYVQKVIITIVIKMFEICYYIINLFYPKTIYLTPTHRYTFGVIIYIGRYVKKSRLKTPGVLYFRCQKQNVLKEKFERRVSKTDFKTCERTYFNNNHIIYFLLLTRTSRSV